MSSSSASTTSSWAVGGGGGGGGGGNGSRSSSAVSPSSYDYSFKILLIGDSGVGKSSLLLTFISSISTPHSPFQHLSPTIGVDFKIKQLTIGGKRLKLTIWDTAGQERFGTLTSSYYRGAHGIILVYDVTRRETFTNLSELWAKEVELYSTHQECIKILVGNKVDRDIERAVTIEEGMALAQEHKCLFYECSAKTRENVQQCFKDLTLKISILVEQALHSSVVLYAKSPVHGISNVFPFNDERFNYLAILERPSLLEQGSIVVKRQILKQKQFCQEKRKDNCCS